MKFKTPKLKDIRIKKRFALFPVELDSGGCVWLESYYAIQQYNEYIMQNDDSVDFTGWLTRYKIDRIVSTEEAEKLIQAKVKKWVDDKVSEYIRRMNF